MNTAIAQLGSNHQQDKLNPQPIFRITKGGIDLSSGFANRLISLTLTDNRSFEADRLDLELDDTDGLLELPSRGAKLSVAIGWTHTGLVDKGVFIVDELMHCGPPDKLTIRARSANLRKGLTTKRDAAFHNMTLGEIINIIAQRHNLKAMIGSFLAGQLLSHIDQTGESDANLLTRIAEMFDAIATVKADKLLFMKAGNAMTASGHKIAGAQITRSVGDRHDFSVSDRDSYDGVIAYYQDTRCAKKGQVIVTTTTEKDIPPSNGKTKKTAPPSVIEHPGNIKTLRHTYANKQNAQRAARAEWHRLQRGMAFFSITMARGNAELYPEVPLTVSGFKPQIDSIHWLLTKVTHTINETGFQSALELEIKATEVPDESK